MQLAKRRLDNVEVSSMTTGFISDFGNLVKTTMLAYMQSARAGAKRAHNVKKRLSALNPKSQNRMEVLSMLHSSCVIAAMSPT